MTLPSEPPAFREGQPLAWTFHRNTSRWLHNALLTDTYTPVPEAPKESPDAPWRRLPDVADTQYAASLRARLSCRTFAPAGVGLDQLSELLWAAYGVTGRSQLGALEFLERPLPSGGGLYALELYTLVRAVHDLPPGVHHFSPITHGLELVRDTDLPPRLLTYLFLGQALAADAAFVVVITAVVARSLTKYGDRGYRYLLLEAGHAAQNLNLRAPALGLGTCNLGGFLDDELAALLAVNVEYEIPLYAIAVGHPESPDRLHQRTLA